MTGPVAPLPKPAGLLAARRCRHQPRCPVALAPDRLAARAVASHPEQGWSLLCNGVVLFDDAGELLPDGRAGAAGAGPGSPGALVRAWLVRARVV